LTACHKADDSDGFSQELPVLDPIWFIDDKSADDSTVEKEIHDG
jgi:hypothetical protein